MVGQEEIVSNCAGGDLNWILEKMSLLKEWSASGTRAQGSGGVALSESVKNPCECGISAMV